MLFFILIYKHQSFLTILNFIPLAFLFVYFYSHCFIYYSFSILYFIFVCLGLCVFVGWGCVRVGIGVCILIFRFFILSFYFLLLLCQFGLFYKEIRQTFTLCKEQAQFKTGFKIAVRTGLSTWFLLL